MNRYGQLIDIVRKEKPKVILETGTWKGKRALQMLEAAPGAKYVGFDLFEDANGDTDREEFNVKPHFTRSEVRKKLNGYDVELVKGNTRDTLPVWIREAPVQCVDLAFIDGGHSVETIKSDWMNCWSVVRLRGGVIVLDDYYTDMPEKRLDEVGCNRLLDEYGEHNEWELLPIKDHVAGGGFVQMAVVRL